jgi:hypothetical protein
VPAWPRYNALSGPGNDADRNGPGHNGFGCYGLNVGIGNIDDDRTLEILVTYDNHHIQAFDHDGVAIDASDYYTNRDSAYRGNRFTWGAVHPLGRPPGRARALQPSYRSLAPSRLGRVAAVDGFATRRRRPRWRWQE